MEVLPTSTAALFQDSPSKKRRRSIEPVESNKVLSMPLAMSPRAMATSPTKEFTAPSTEESVSTATDAGNDSDEEDGLLLCRSLMGLSLQLKLKMILVEAWASDMNSVVMERNLFAIANELAILKEMGVYEEQTCVRFLELARNRMINLLAQSERRETLQMEALQMWTMAQIQAQEKMFAQEQVMADTEATEFPLLTGYDASSRDISVLWKAMSIARDRGAQLWHDNKPEQALPFLLAADSYMKRFTLKYQRLKIDHAMLETFQNEPVPVSPRRKTTKVTFVEEPQVLGVADSDVDRSPICPTKPSRLESLLLRTSREFPTPRF